MSEVRFKVSKLDEDQPSGEVTSDTETKHDDHSDVKIEIADSSCEYLTTITLSDMNGTSHDTQL